MKFVAEKNEVAGSTVQKLQGAQGSDVLSGAVTAVSASALDSGLFGRKKDLFTSVTNFDWPANSSTGQAAQSAPVTVPTPAGQPGAQADRVAQLINGQVVSLRQSGADTLAVSLKLDSHTEISLQLTTHDGQIQAAVRCERGSLSGLDGHWNDLQSSLAKQNVQLLPLDDKSPARATTLNLAANTGGSQNFNQSSQQAPRQARELPEDSSPGAASTVKTVRNPQPQKQNLSRRGWETWA